MDTTIKENDFIQEQIQEYLKDAENGNPYAMGELAEIYRKKNDIGQFLYWAGKAAEMGIEQAHVWLAKYYLWQPKTEESAFKVMYHFSCASLLGDGKASFALALLYRNGYYDGIKMESAYYLYLHKAIIQGVKDSLEVYKYSRLLSECYAKGIGCTPSPCLAAFWLVKFRRGAYLEGCLEHRVKNDPLCHKAFLLWMADHSYMSLNYLEQAVGKGSVIAMSIIGKLCCCLPVVIHLYETYFTDNLARLDDGDCLMGLTKVSVSESILAPIRERGLRLLEKAAASGDESAAVTLQRIADGDLTLPYMISPFQP
ncbi:MAG: hypothetical protein K2H57_07535 [Duncaniella sp.]|nr:hypothetical protein [Duncaniella sp.]